MDVLDVVVPSGSVGTYQLYCQILARHVGKHLDGGTINFSFQKGEIEGRGNFYTSYLGVWPGTIRDNLITFLARISPEG